MVHPMAEANEKSLFGSLTPAEFYARHSMTQFITNPKGLKLFTQWWISLPPTKIIGTVVDVHSYTDESSWFVQPTSILFVKSSFTTCVIDHQRHIINDEQDLASVELRWWLAIGLCCHHLPLTPSDLVAMGVVKSGGNGERERRVGPS
ncbi:acylglycerol lipase [Sarracenia purpurea var. burkii]